MGWIGVSPGLPFQLIQSLWAVRTFHMERQSTTGISENIEGESELIISSISCAADTVPAASYNELRREMLKLEEFVEAGFHETSQREKKLKRVERECHLYKKEVCKLRRKLARVAAAQFPWPNLCPACPRSFFLFEPLDEVLPEPDHNVQLGVRMSLGAARDEVFTEV